MAEFAQRQIRAQGSHLVNPAKPGQAALRPAHIEDALLAGQQAWGNQAMQRLLRAGLIQAKLTINEPGDQYEQEADRVADQVMRMPEPKIAEGAAVSRPTHPARIQRMCPECEEELHRQPIEEGIPDSEQTQGAYIQRMCLECEQDLHRQPMEEEEEETLQAKEISGSTPEVTSDVQAKVNAMRGSGQPLPKSVRTFFEPRFGYDFSQVRIHTDVQAAESARSVNALAYTAGQEVVFGGGQYSPSTAAGQRLLAHELTHVVQQGAGADSMFQRLEGPCKDEPTLHRRLIRGSVHPAVREAQRKLNLFHEQQTKAGNPGLTDAPLVPDCIFGQKTFNAVFSFQEHVFPGQPEHHVGQIGDRTWAELDKITGTPTPTSAPAPVPPVSPSTPTPAPPSTIRTVSIWLNAFIPRDLPGLTETVPVGPHAGKTKVPGPTTRVSDCFLTDQRDFSNSRSASSRMHSLVDIDVQFPPFSKSLEIQSCSPTHEIDCEDGEEECTESGDITGMKFSLTTTVSPTFLMINLEGASNNPCFTLSPDITYKGNIFVDLASRTVFFAMGIDQFPAFEMYAAAEGGAGVKLFREPPPPGNTPTSLITSGGPNRAMAGSSTI